MVGRERHSSKCLPENSFTWPESSLVSALLWDQESCGLGSPDLEGVGPVDGAEGNIDVRNRQTPAQSTGMGSN